MESSKRRGTDEEIRTGRKQESSKRAEQVKESGQAGKGTE